MWVSPIHRILNPSYWLLGRLLQNLAEDETVYVVSDSMTPVGRMLPYRGQPVDKIVVMGVAYSPGAIGSSFKKGYVRHERAFRIAEIVRRAYEQFRPEVVELTVDVRRWYQDAADCFGFWPDRVITEQEMRWQQVGYLLTHELARQNRFTRQRRFAFSGNAKQRYPKMIRYMEHLPIPATIHGGGWEPHLGQMDHVWLEGTQPYWRSAHLMLSSQYGLTLHEPVGEEAEWITAKFYENLGTDLVNFVDLDYDRGELELPHSHPLRVESGEELRDKIEARPYEEWNKLQRELIDPSWLDWRGWYYLPFRERLRACA